MKRIIVILAILKLIIGSATAQIGESTYDYRVRNQLNELGLKYEITSSGDFRVIFNMGNGRTQLVVIYSKTYYYESMEIREITSIAAKVKYKSDFVQTLLFQLLEKNFSYKLGSWQMHGGESPYILQFAVRISANSPANILEECIKLATKEADRVEEIITEEDLH